MPLRKHHHVMQAVGFNDLRHLLMFQTLAPHMCRINLVAGGCIGALLQGRVNPIWQPGCCHYVQ